MFREYVLIDVWLFFGIDRMCSAVAVTYPMRDPMDCPRPPYMAFKMLSMVALKPLGEAL